MKGWTILMSMFAMTAAWAGRASELAAHALQASASVLPKAERVGI